MALSLGPGPVLRASLYIFFLGPADELRATAYLKQFVACGSAHGENLEDQKHKNKCHIAAFPSTRDWSDMRRRVAAAVPRSGGSDARHATPYYCAAFT
jgi:hypothetical protein